MTSLQNACASMAVAQSQASDYRMARIHVEQAAARIGKPQRDFNLRMGAAMASHRLMVVADAFNRTVFHRAAANESIMEPEVA